MGTKKLLPIIFALKIVSCGTSPIGRSGSESESRQQEGKSTEPSANSAPEISFGVAANSLHTADLGPVNFKANPVQNNLALTQSATTVAPRIVSPRQGSTINTTSPLAQWKLGTRGGQFYRVHRVWLGEISKVNGTVSVVKTLHDKLEDTQSGGPDSTKPADWINYKLPTIELQKTYRFAVASCDNLSVTSPATCTNPQWAMADFVARIGTPTLVVTVPPVDEYGAAFTYKSANADSLAITTHFEVYAAHLRNGQIIAQTMENDGTDIWFPQLAAPRVPFASSARSYAWGNSSSQRPGDVIRMQIRACGDGMPQSGQNYAPVLPRKCSAWVSANTTVLTRAQVTVDIRILRPGSGTDISSMSFDKAAKPTDERCLHEISAYTKVCRENDPATGDLLLTVIPAKGWKIKTMVGCNLDTRVQNLAWRTCRYSHKYGVVRSVFDVIQSP